MRDSMHAAGDPGACHTRDETQVHLLSTILWLHAEVVEENENSALLARKHYAS